MSKKLVRTSFLTVLVLGGCLTALARPATAATFVKFYNGGSGYTGPYNGAGTVYNDITTKGVTTELPEWGCFPLRQRYSELAEFEAHG